MDTEVHWYFVVPFKPSLGHLFERCIRFTTNVGAGFAGSVLSGTDPFPTAGEPDTGQ